MLAISSCVQAELKAGACPVRDQNKAVESFEKYSMAGLWYEYVWDTSFKLEYPYQCSTWIVLSDEADKGEGKYQVYNNMVFTIEEDEESGERDAEFIKFSMEWDPKTDAGQKARASFKRKNDEDEDKETPALIANFIDTDYH